MLILKIASIVSFAGPAFSKPIRLIPFERREYLDSSLPGITPTATDNAASVILSSAACMATFQPDRRRDCGDVATSFWIQTTGDEALLPSDSEECEYLLSRFHVCKTTTKSSSVSPAMSKNNVDDSKMVMTLTLTTTLTYTQGTGLSTKMRSIKVTHTSETVLASAANEMPHCSSIENPTITASESPARVSTSPSLNGLSTMAASDGFPDLSADVVTCTKSGSDSTGSLAKRSVSYSVTGYSSLTSQSTDAAAAAPEGVVSTSTLAVAAAAATSLSSQSMETSTVDETATSVSMQAATPSTSLLAQATSNATGAVAPAPTQTGSLSCCLRWYVAVADDNCATVAIREGLDVNTFMAWNLAVEAPSCKHMLVGYAYCVEPCDFQAATTYASSALSVQSALATLSMLSAPTLVSGAVAATSSAASALVSNGTSTSLTSADNIQSALVSVLSIISAVTAETTSNAGNLSIVAVLTTLSSVASVQQAVMPTSSSESTSILVISTATKNSIVSNGTTSAVAVSTTTNTPTPVLVSASTSLLIASAFKSATKANSTMVTASTTGESADDQPTAVISANITASVFVNSTVTVSSTAPTTSSAKDVYRTYSGDGSEAAGWPSVNEWVDFESMFDLNRANMQASCAQWGVPNNTDDEITELKTIIQSTAKSSDIDARFILAIVLQESTGCVRVITTRVAVSNPGLMQSHSGAGSCNTNTAEVQGVGGDGVVQTPCPSSEISQMIEDGTRGTSSGDGLMQIMQKQGHTDVSRWYRTARMYNAGSLDPSGNLDVGCCTASYASDIANRLTGWVNAPRNSNY